MNDLQIERLANELVAQIRAGRRTSFTTSDSDLRARILARVGALLAGRALEDTPD
jgi:hypothetical protein